MSHQPVTTSHTASPEERELVIKQIYKQVLERQPYESERRQLSDLEREFIKGKIGVRHFLKMLSVSRLYLEEFYEKSSNVKFIENAFKHFLGRTPHHEEIRNYDNLLLRQGVGAMISEIIDSEEYRKAYGIFTVPFWRGDQTYESPSDYIENRFLEEEHTGQRGWGVPAVYRHEIDHELHVDHPKDGSSV